jgi:uncharacterized protein (DUF1697 family)
MLRGVNVGGNNIIRMAELRDLCCELGLIEPETLVQSGNIVFRAPKLSTAKVAAAVSDGIHRKFGFRPETVVRTVSELQSTIERNPFAVRMDEINGSRLLVIFFGREPTALPALTTQTTEEVHFMGKELYVYYPDGMGTSKLGQQLDRLLKASVPTARNWNTVTKLLEMAKRKL